MLRIFTKSRISPPGSVVIFKDSCFCAPWCWRQRSGPDVSTGVWMKYLEAQVRKSAALNSNLISTICTDANRTAAAMNSGVFHQRKNHKWNWCCGIGEGLGVMANIACLTALSGRRVYPMSVLGSDTGSVRAAKYLCCHVLTENHLPILSRSSPTMISSNFNVCTILDFCGYLLSRRCNISMAGVRGSSREWAAPVISPWQLMSHFHVHLETDLGYD